jgi:hypothetical protein
VAVGGRPLDSRRRELPYSPASGAGHRLRRDVHDRPIERRAAADVARGTNGTLRANYNGQPVQVDDPIVAHYFNTTAFSAPATGEFGNALRNMIVGPGNRQLNANFSRDVRMGRNRSLSFQLNANNLLNMVQWSAVDTNVNSLSFGQVTSVRPMRSMTLSIRVRF